MELSYASLIPRAAYLMCMVMKGHLFSVVKKWLKHFITLTENVRNNGDELCYECLPPCTDIWYEPEISYAPFPGRGFNLSRTYRRLVNDLNVPAGTDGNEYLKSVVFNLN